MRLIADGKLVETAVGDHALSYNSKRACVVDGATRIYFQGGAAHRVALRRGEGTQGSPASSGDILSPMPGRIIAVDVAAGQTVNKGQKLLTLEAMKMEHSLTAPFDGVVAELNAAVGAQVQVEALLVRIEAVE